MDFRTRIDIPRSGLSISHKSHIVMMGSCFIENIGKLLIENKFDVNLNPFGILYNPLSISQALKFMIERKRFDETDIFEHQGLYHSFWHHGAFSNVDKVTCLSAINESIDKAADDLRNADVLFITFGTAYVFYSKKQEIVVGNCHKLPASDFDRYCLSVEDIVNEWVSLIKTLREINPLLQIIFTVSPIRHLKDGAHDNQLSKSALLLAIDKICGQEDRLHYFPSYEIVLDELRDYRFYNEDMIHPNTVAVKYIWERLSVTYFDEEAHPVIEEWRKLYQALNHRPINKESEEYKHFLRQTLLKLKAFNEKYPYICCTDEISDLESRS
ncbi:GSCFA domain protein [Dysgonomonas sp. 521]|uniref:GSCFA domain-containing protein n=1 Tax=Dysgonomonas sp. 521 TaxID=2302932 RepID=UPI0013CFCA00|nr:GSCFA domain-containing protein [Dysgonomonas sp. 521]NDV94707.1 GSCFA domain protein [Dysgonomonas sp. 521]